jgi:predicted dehydrogenase
MEEKRKLRFAVIGTGEFAEACHVPGLQSHPCAEVVALCGSDYERTRAAADRLGIPEVHTDYRELCSHEDIDGITIATPNVFHVDRALAAFRHGKHVLCEKPLGMDVGEARRMTDAAEASGKIHQVAFTFRYGYAVRELRRRVRAGDIGQPYYLRVQYDAWTGLLPDWKIGWREKRDLAGGGMLYDLGSHLFDVAQFVLGPTEIVTGFVQNFPRQRIDSFTGELTRVETDDIAAAWFRHQNGARGQWFISRVTPPYAENGYLEIIGQEGALKASLSRGKVDLLKVSLPSRPEWEELPLPPEARDGKPHCLGIMMRSFVDACLRGKLDGDVDASFHAGLAAQQAIEAVIEANDRLTWVSLNHTTA